MHLLTFRNNALGRVAAEWTDLDDVICRVVGIDCSQIIQMFKASCADVLSPQANREHVSLEQEAEIVDNVQGHISQASNVA
jgi:hypothetical protein